MTLTEEARNELADLPGDERQAMDRAIRKLALLGESLGFPHTSAVRGAAQALRELRPRAGRSRWRAFYRRVGDRLVVVAIGPEAGVDPSGFRTSVDRAVRRLEQREHDGDGA